MKSLLGSLMLTGFAALALACSSSDPEDVTAASAATPGQAGYILTSGSALQDVLLDGAAREIVSFDDGSVLMDPALSPDGKRIAFIRQEPVKNIQGGIDFGADLYLVNRDGSELREIAHHSALAEYIRMPSWLDADQLLFSIRGRSPEATADYRIERMDLRSVERTRVVANAVDPSVTPGASRMLYVSVETATTRETLVISAVDGSGARDLLPPSPVLTLVGSAVMSPDGSQIAFAAGDLLGSRAMPASPPRSMAAPAKSPASPMISALPMFSASVHPFFQDVWLIDVDGSNLRRVAEVVERSLSLSWSPDGKFIYAMGTERFRRVKVASGTLTDLNAGSIGAGIYFYETK